MKAMKDRAKAAMSLLQDLHVLHGKNTNVLFFKKSALLKWNQFQS